MFHKVRTVTAIEDYKLIVEFCEGVTKLYDIKPWFERQKVFNNLKNNDLFKKVRVDFGGLGICWNSEIDLECDELFYEGETIKSKFDGLIALSDVHPAKELLPIFEVCDSNTDFMFAQFSKTPSLIYLIVLGIKTLLCL